MAHSYCNSLMHCVFSTKDRRRVIHPEIAVQLFPYLGGIAREHGMKALTVGGVEDHVHVLLSLPATITVAKAMQTLKAASSKWVSEQFPEARDFTWQEGYGAFSIGVSQVERTRRYIDRQAEHHREESFEEEFIRFLKRHGIEYDPRHVFG